jgi:deoxyribodipyrimidine photo-lyase
VSSWGIHWFRRDLRVTGNRTLLANAQRMAGRTLGLFCFDSRFLARKDFSHNRFAFFLETLSVLREDWRKVGGDLLVVDAQPVEALTQILARCRSQNMDPPQLVSWNRDYEPFARARDATVQSWLAQHQIEHLDGRDHLLFEPHEIAKPTGDFYQVYSPFARNWFARLHSSEGVQRLREQQQVDRQAGPRFTLQWAQLFARSPMTDALEKFQSANRKAVTVPIPTAGYSAAQSQLKKFSKSVQDYGQLRDIPSLAGTSRLSIYLKNGSLTTPQIIAALSLGKESFISPSWGARFVKELAWREFYYAILYHSPRVERESFRPEYAQLRWTNNRSWFARWQQGTTGFPIVDAGMRELATTGWMHNRVRMIVASFLTKDLLIDWRRGESHFMHQLLDGDLAPNNGGWQWAASTGCDPQPYFRIFNPWLQSAKFDPQGDYIRRFVPELRQAPAAVLHREDADRSPWKYPKPIVQHALQREKALRLYSSVKK